MAKRQSNFELLRMIVMLTIVMRHFILSTKQVSNPESGDFLGLNFLFSLFAVSVNVFVLLSGYFSIKLKFFKLAQLDLRVVVYTYVLFALVLMLGIHSLNLKKDFLLLFPVLTKQYWFITDYFVLCLLSPFLNWFLERQSKRNLQLFLIIGFIVFYVLATGAFLVNANQIENDSGRGIVNFVFLYVLGYYLRNHFHDFVSNCAKYFSLFFLSSSLNFFVNFGMTKIFGFYYNSLVSNNTVFVLLGSIFLFMAFKNLKIGYQKTINLFASKSFVVYIIHTFPLIQSYLYSEIIRVQNYSGITLFLMCFVSSFAIYLLCFGIDWVMDFLLRPLEKLLKKLLVNKEIILDQQYNQ